MPVDRTGLANSFKRVFSSKIDTKRLLKRGVMAFFVFVQLGIVFMSGEVFAVTSDETLINKTLANAIYKCYFHNGVKTDKYMVDEITTIQASFNDTIERRLLTNDGGKDGTIKVPTRYGNTLRDGDISCLEVFTGWNVRLGSGKIEGLLEGDLRGEELLTKLGYVKTNRTENDVDDENFAIWQKISPTSATTALRNLTGFNSFSESKFTEQEVYDLYMGYLFGTNSIYEGLYTSSDCSTDKNNSDKSIPIADEEGGIKWCEVLGEGLSSNEKVNVFQDGRRYYLEESVGIEGLIERVRNLDIGDISLIDADEETGEVGQTIAVTSDKSKCLSGGGARALGWIICPVLEWIGKASNQIYNDLIVDALKVDAKLFTDEGREELENSGTRIAWETFRNVANTGFVLMLLVVIFSQLTGVGINNYGIKKILPKLIIAAILVNLSYLICLIAMDLSNILGGGFQAVFDSLGNKLEVANVKIGDEELNTAAATATGLTGVGVLIALIAGGAAVYANPAILLTLFVSAIGLIIAIFFLFMLLAVREAAIVVLVVVSPIVIVLYSLPNTKKIFDRWLRFFGGLLLVFPICSLLVGAGNYVSKLLMTEGMMGKGGFFSAFTAMIVSIVPIFLIPTVLKGSFSAMGKIGARLTELGGRARRAGVGAMRGTDVYKNAQERGLERKTRIRAGVDTEGRARKLSGIGRFFRGGNRNIARSRAQYLKNQDMDMRTESLMGVGFEAATIGQEKRAVGDEIANYMMLINHRTDNGANEGALLEMFDDYMSEGNKNGAVAVARIAGRRKDTAARFMTNTIMEGANSSGVPYNAEIMRSVAKEMSEGERSGNYRSGMPVGFEYAAKVNQGATATPFKEWSMNVNNINEAMQHHVTNSSELVGAQNSALRFVAERMEAGGMSEAEVERIRNLARETIQNRGTTGVWDTTKEENIYRIAYGAEGYQARINEDRARGIGEQTAVNMGAGDPTSFNVREAEAAQAATRQAQTVNQVRSVQPVRQAQAVNQVRPVRQAQGASQGQPVRQTQPTRQARTGERGQTDRRQSRGQRPQP